MDPRFAVLRFLKALSYKDTRDASAWLHDDFFIRSSMKRFKKEEFLQIFEAVFDAFPDWEIDHEEAYIQNGAVEINIRMSGTHTNTLLLNFQGLKPVAATGKRVILPKQKLVCVVDDMRITQIRPVANPEAGLIGMLRQLGVKLPPLWWLNLTGLKASFF